MGKIVKVSGPLVVATGMADANMSDVVRVGEQRLIGEILTMNGDAASIQVYEETSGLGPGAEVVTTGAPLSVELGPGLMENIYDGIQRPLEAIMARSAAPAITRGVEVPALNREKKWDFVPTGQGGRQGRRRRRPRHRPGDARPSCTRSWCPPVPSGTVESIHVRRLHRHRHGSHRPSETDGSLKELTMVQKWPVRVGRPYKQEIYPRRAPCSPASVSSTPCSPWPRAAPPPSPAPSAPARPSCSTQLAKWSDVDIVVYIGCGERGNEMTDVLREFPELIDPRTGESLMKRTVLIANTSDMPVAAREASIYTGITIAEYFRDMGYDVAVIADSTSRWAEALREMSGRLEEMPGEEGYPAYLASRLAQFYERAGVVQCLGSDEDAPRQPDRRGRSLPSRRRHCPSLSPRRTMRIVKVFWSLDSSLAYAPSLPGHQLAELLLPVSGQPEALVRRKSGRELPARTATSAMAILQEEAEPERDRPAGRQGRPVRRRPAHAGDRQDDPRGLPAAERLRATWTPISDYRPAVP